MRRVAAFLRIALLCAAMPTGVLASPFGSERAFTPAPTAPSVALEQRLGAALPLTAPFTDSDGRPLRLGDALAPGRPTILLLGYDRCPQLCGLTMQGLLDAIHATGLPAGDVHVVFASLDPDDTPADAAERRRVDLAYARFLADGDAAAPVPTLVRLVGPPASIAALTRAVGDVYQPTPGDAARFAHPAGLVVVTPDGRVSRYLMGVQFDASELRDALAAAADGRVGTLTDRLALLCAHLDPTLGAATPAVLVGLRVAGFATLALLVALVMRQRALARRRLREAA